MADGLKRYGALCGLLLIAVAAQAQTVLHDPTRPPASMGESVSDVAAGSGPVLQTVIIPGKGKPVAIISGQQVSLGGKVGDSRLVRLTEREAVLVGPAGTERLPLTPEAQKVRVERNGQPGSTVAKSAQTGSR